MLAWVCVRGDRVPCERGASKAVHVAYTGAYLLGASRYSGFAATMGEHHFCEALFVEDVVCALAARAGVLSCSGRCYLD